MSSLTAIEKRKFEKLFGMDTGYVINFSNNSFQGYILDSVGIDIYNDDFAYGSGSKANRLRAFWDKEPDYLTGKLLADLLEYWRTEKLSLFEEITSLEQALVDECSHVAQRLQQGGPVENLDALRVFTDERGLKLLVASIKESVHKGEPGTALDRLHTYVTKYIRVVCERRGITVGSKPLHSLFAEYANVIKRSDQAKTPMTQKILKSQVRLLEDFNHIRNWHSFAHDNPILDYEESILVINNVLSILRYVQVIEGDTQHEDGKDKDVLDWNS